MTDKEISMKRELILIAAVLSLALALLGGQALLRGHGTVAQVMVAGEVVCTLPLAKNTRLEIPGALGTANVLVVENGAIRCESASCPDQLCVKQGRQTMAGGTIVCLPNKMAVTILAD